MKKTKLALPIGIFTLVVSGLIAFLDPLKTVQWKISDVFFRERGASSLITIVAIDDKSLSPEADLGRFKDWPRSYYSQVLRIINQNAPAVIAFDLDFKEPSRGMSDLRIKQLLREYERKSAAGGGLDWYALVKRFETDSDQISEHPDDVDFQEALLESRPVALASSLIFNAPPDEKNDSVPSVRSEFKPIFSGENISSGFINVFPDRDRILRRFIPSKNSFPFRVSAAYFKNKPALQDSRGGRMAALALESPKETALIVYAAKPFAYKTVSFVDVIAGRTNAADFKDKIVLVGPTAAVIQDFQNTPASRVRMPGVEVNANIIQQIIEGRTMKEQGFWGMFGILTALCVLGAVVLFAVNLNYLGAVFALVLFGFPLLAYASYQGGAVMNVVYPELAWIFTGLGVLWQRNKTEIRMRSEIRKAFSHYVSPIVVNELVKDPASIKLGGKRQQISVLFSDIVGFTTLAEKLSPEDTVAVLNSYLTAMTESIFANRGTLDKYQGDAIMALFGAPLDDEHHALNACHTALGMRRALSVLHEKWSVVSHLPMKEDLIQLDFRVGIATGFAVVGNVGSEKRFDYTAIGDIVNLGSRLEGVNKKYGTRIIVDRETFAAVTENHNPFVFRKLDTVRVKGKKHETEIFELYSLAENVTSDVKTMLDDFENGRMLYSQRNFVAAKQYFESALAKTPADAPSQIYKNRCNFFLRKPPSLDWTPVVNLEEK